IAGLIFLVVFLALPALQRSQRDTQRKSDLSRMMSQITTYTGNHQGILPTDWTNSQTGFEGTYLTNNGSTFNDPQTGNAYTITSTAIPAANTTTTLTAGNINVYPGAKCDGAVTAGVSAGAGARSIAAVVFQEQGGFYCQSN